MKTTMRAHEPERNIKIMRIVNATEWHRVSEEWNPNAIGTDAYDTPRAAALYEALGASKDDADYSLCSNSKGLWALIGTTQSGDRYAVESEEKVIAKAKGK
jgi:hypothetical protein